MATIVTYTESTYKLLGEVLAKALGYKPQRWLAEQTFVSQEAVHYWLTGQNRPRPDRLGQLAALLELDPLHLATLAEYHDPAALDKVLAAHTTWCAVLRKGD